LFSRKTFILPIVRSPLESQLTLGCKPLAAKKNRDLSMKDIEEILDLMFPFVENLLIENGEFYPFAAAMKNNGKIDQVGISEDDDNPASQKVIDELKEVLISMKDDYKAYALFYDVYHKGDEINAIAIKVEHKLDLSSFTFYYPYELDNGRLIYKEAWKTEKQMEIF